MDINVKWLVIFLQFRKERMTSGWCTARLLTRSTVSSFWLHTIDSLVRASDKDSRMTDRDVGNVFLNFQLHRTVVPFPGVDLSSLQVARAIWDGNLMRFMTLPNNSIMMALITEEICMNDPHEEQVGSDGKELNPLQWKRIRLNLPVTKTS